MSSVSTRTALENANVEVYRAMAPAQDYHPEASWVEMKTGLFVTKDDLFISLKEQRGLNDFMKEVANDIRKDHGGMCPSEVLYKEATRRMKLAIRKVAGKKETRDGKLLSKAEIGRIQNPLLRAMVERAAEKKVEKEEPSYSYSSYDDSSTDSTPRAGPGPFYYGDMPPDGPYYDDSPSMGPDGPNRRYNDRGWGPDSTYCEPGCSFGGGSDTIYVGGYPLI